MPKFLFQMVRLTFILSILFMMHNSYASSQNLKNTKVSLNENNATLVDIFNQIANITNFNFTYSSYITEKEERFDAVYQKQSLEYVLTDLGNRAGFSYFVNEKDIMVAAQNTNLGSTNTSIQQRLVIGTVIDVQGLPLPGANVIEKGTSNGVITDMDGAFSIDVTSQDVVLVVSFIGYISKEITVGEKTNIQVVLQEDEAKLDEVVVVGYGKESKRNLTSSIGSIASKSIKDLPVTSVEQAFAGQIPGVEVIQSSGRPGQSNQINVRGMSTITAGNNPLIVVDGLPLSEGTQLNSINPQDIQSIDVLKDAASAAIYGSRGSNGVIIISTKKGEIGKTTYSFDAFTGIQVVANKLDLMNASQHSQWTRDARNNYYMQFSDGSFSVNDDDAKRAANSSMFGFNAGAATIPSYVKPYLDGQQGLPDTDWQDELFRQARIESYQLSASGGNENTRYFISGNYFNQEGIVLGTDFQRISFRTNLETKLSDRLKLNLNLTPTLSTENAIPEGFNDSPVNQIYMALPYFPAYNADGSLNISEQSRNNQGQALAENPVAMAVMNKNKQRNRQLIGGTSLEYQFIEGLTLKTYLGIDYSNLRREAFFPSSVGQRNVPAPDIATGSAFASDRLNWISENTLAYETTLGEGHNFDGLLGYSYQKETFNSNEVAAADFPNDFVQTLNAGIVNGGSSFASEWTLISYLGRVRYNFQDKYLFSAAIRRDGSSRFGSNNRWGVFPSVSAGYRIVDEDFFPQTNFLSDLKVRASWGITGNNQIGDFGSQALLSSANAILGGGIVNGLAPSSSPNPNLGWEQTTTTDLGVDFGLFDDRIYASFDYYVSTTDDLLLEVPVPAHSGYTNSLQNIGKVENRGIELNINANYNLGPVKVVSSLNYVNNNNKVLELGPGQEEIISNGIHITRVGDELGAAYGYRVLGIFTSQDQIDNTPSLANAQIGEYIYKDSNGDGQITADDREILGSIHPDFTYGFTTRFEYKGFELSGVIQGVEGVHIHNRTNSVLLYNPESWGNGSVDYFNNYYTPERGDQAIYSRPNTRPTDNGFYRNTDLLQEDASFLRVRNITLAYLLPQVVLDKMGMTGLRFYLSSKNPFTSTDFRGYNPEQRSGNSLSPTEGWGNYPLERSFVFGLNLKF